MQLILSTSNVMNGYPSVIRVNAVEQSNTELITSLRTNIQTAKQDASPPPVNGSVNGNGRPTNGHAHPTRLPSWTSKEGSVIYVPSIPWSAAGLAEDRTQYDITLKLFYLPGAPVARRRAQTLQAFNLAVKELGVTSVDLLIASFPNVAFDAEHEGQESGDRHRRSAGLGPHKGDTKELEDMVDTWRMLEELHAQGTIKKLGVSEFGSQLLGQFMQRVSVRPLVNQINVRTCCVVPRQTMQFAKENNIELFTHNDCTDILPRGTLRELLGPGEKGADILSGSGQNDTGLSGDVEPQWVIKYTAVIQDRGVVENKGYFAMAELRDV